MAMTSAAWNSLELPECPPKLLDAIKAGRAVAVVGSGLSRGSDAPSWGELLERIGADALRLCPQRASDVKDAMDLLALSNFLEGASVLEGVLGPEFRRTVTRQFDGVRKPRSSHHVLTRLPFRAIVTTNYDRLLELAAPPSDRWPTRYWTDPALATRVRDDREFILKWHGDIQCPETIVITREDYSKLANEERARGALSTLLSSSVPLFIGYGHRDPELDSLLDTLRFKSGLDGGYAIVSSSDNALNARLRDAKIFQIQLERHEQVETFVERIGRALGLCVVKVDRQWSTAEAAMSVAISLAKGLGALLGCVIEVRKVRPGCIQITLELPPEASREVERRLKCGDDELAALLKEHRVRSLDMPSASTDGSERTRTSMHDSSLVPAQSSLSDSGVTSVAGPALPVMDPHATQAIPIRFRLSELPTSFWTRGWLALSLAVGAIATLTYVSLRAGSRSTVNTDPPPDNVHATLSTTNPAEDCAVKFVSFDPADRDAFDAIAAEFHAREGIRVDRVSYDENSFKSNWRHYLRENRNSVFAWLAGEQVRQAAENDFLERVDDVWAKVSGQLSDSVKHSYSTLREADYSIPFKTYPWAVYYRKSLLKTYSRSPENVPTTWNEYLALAKRMKADGLTPIAFGNKEGWPAIGTFDILNLRINGYDFHMSLMGGTDRWNQRKVKNVFRRWSELIPYYSQGWEKRSVEDGTREFAQGRAGMYFIGGFFVKALDEPTNEDIDVFAFPKIGSGPQDSVDAPLDSFVLSKSNPEDQRGTECAKKLLVYLTRPEAFDLYNSRRWGYLPVALGTKQSAFAPLQLRAEKVLAAAQHVSRFMDREMDSDFVKSVVIPQLQRFLSDAHRIADRPEKTQDRDTALDDLVDAVVFEIQQGWDAKRRKSQ